MEASGRHFFPTYALQFMTEFLGSQNHVHYYTLVLDLIITISVSCSSILVRMMKVRTLLFFTGFSALVVLFLGCTYIFLASNDVISKDRPWIAVLLFLVYFILINLGCAPISLALLAEVFPLAHRLTAVVATLLLIFTLKITPYLLIDVKTHGTFGIFGAITAIALLILYFVLPETKGKTLQEIEDYFTKRNSRNSSKFQLENDVDKNVLDEEENLT
ncbi:facilitated trehalose transporter Tret1-like [Aphomia sociella]